MELRGFLIKDISREGAIFVNGTNKVYVNFDDCIKNFNNEFGAQSKACVATRCVHNYSYTFFTNPKTIICLKKRGILSRYFSTKRFHLLQKRLLVFGLTTYDMS